MPYQCSYAGLMDSLGDICRFCFWLNCQASQFSAGLGKFPEATYPEIFRIAGQPLRIICNRPESFPLATIYWVKDDSSGGAQIDQNDRVTMDPDGKFSSFPSSFYHWPFISISRAFQLPFHLSVTFPFLLCLLPVTPLSSLRHLPITSPALPYRLSVASPSPLYHLSYISLSPPYRLSVASPGLSVTSPLPLCHLSIASLSPPHHDGILCNRLRAYWVSLKIKYSWFCFCCTKWPWCFFFLQVLDSESDGRSVLVSYYSIRVFFCNSILSKE